MVPICSHCPNCSTQWSLVVLTAVPNAPICSTQLSPLQRPIVPTAVPKASICIAQCFNLKCLMVLTAVPNHLQCPMAPSAFPKASILYTTPYSTSVRLCKYQQ